MLWPRFRLQATEKGLSVAQNSVPKKQAEIEAAKAECFTTEEGYKAAVEGIEKAEQQKYAVQMGMTADDGGEAKTFAQQIADTKTELNTLASEVEQAKLRVSHQKPLLAKKKAAAKGAEKEHATMVKTLGENEKSVEKIKATMDGLDFSEEKEAALETEQGQVQADLRNVNDQVDRLGAKLANFEFNYKNPEPGFDRSKVSGLVAELIEVKDKAAMTALEVTAGGKLYNVVVDTESTGKKLLKNGKLKRRVTIIPLNKIQPREVAADKVARAKAMVGSENANVALSFVGYDAKVDAAMKYVFGGNFICPDMNTAKKVTFNDKIRTKSVTLDGDVMDPSGTLTGGSRPNTAPVLAQLHELKAAKAKQTALEAQFKTISEQLVTLRKSSAKYAQLKEQFDIKQHEIELARSRIEQSSAHQTVAEVEELTASLAESEQILNDSKEGEKVRFGFGWNSFPTVLPQALHPYPHHTPRGCCSFSASLRRSLCADRCCAVRLKPPSSSRRSSGSFRTSRRR